MTSNKLIILVLAFASLEMVAQNNISWPLANTLNQINCTFSELHGYTPTHLHSAIDINCTDKTDIRSIMSGGRIDAIHNDFITVIYDFPPNNPNGHLKKIILGDDTRFLSNYKIGDNLALNEYFAETFDGGHLHFEMWIRDNVTSPWRKVDPLKNNVVPNYTNIHPNITDVTDPIINDIFLEPANNNSGYVLFNTAASSGLHPLNYATRNYLRVHLANRRSGGGTGPHFFGGSVHNGSSKFMLYGNIGSILHARDPEVTIATNGNPNASGEGLGVYSSNFRIDGVDKYSIEFDEILQAEYNFTTDYYHTEFNNGNIYPNDGTYRDRNGVTHIYNSAAVGNDDYLELRRNDAGETARRPHKAINGIQSNGIWATRARVGTPDVFATTPVPQATCPDDAKYNDGKHTLSYTVSDAGNRSTTVDLEPILDNFKPFVKRVVARVQTNTIMDEKWVCCDLGIKKIVENPDRVTQKSLDDYGMNVFVYTSEPLKDQPNPANPLTLSVSNYPNLTVTFVTKNVENDYFVYHISGPDLKLFNKLNLVINGQDLAENQLLNFSGESGSCMTIPTRTGANTWSKNFTNGPEISYKIYIDEDCSDQLISNNVVDRGIACSNVSYKTTYLPNGCSVRFQINSNRAPNHDYKVLDFGDGAFVDWTFGQQFSDIQEHTYSDNGTYVSTLKYYSNSVLVGEATKTVNIVSCGASGTLSCQINGPQFAAAGEEITLSVTALGGQPPFGHDWTFLPTQVTQIGVDNFKIRENNIWVDDELEFTSELTDQFGNESVCYHKVIIRNDSPKIKIRPISEDDKFLANNKVFFQYNVDGFPYSCSYTTVVKNKQTLATKTINGYFEGGNWAYLPNQFVQLEEGFYEATVYSWGVSAKTDFKVGNPAPNNSTPGYSFGPPNQLTLDCTNDPTLSIIGLSTDAFYNGFWRKGWNLRLTFTNVANSADRFSTPWFIEWYQRDQFTPNNDPPPLIYPKNYLEGKFGTWTVTAELCPAPIPFYQNFPPCKHYIQNSQGGYDDETVTIEALGKIKVQECPITIQKIDIVDKGCNQIVAVTAIGGITQPVNSDCGLIKKYKNYKWKAFDAEHPDVEIKDLLEDTEGQPCAKINKNSAYFKNYKTGELVSFFCKVYISDYWDYTADYTAQVFLNVPFRLNLPDAPLAIRRCPGTKTNLTNEPIGIGGNGNESITWSINSSQITLDTKDPWRPKVIVPSNYSGGSTSITAIVREKPGCEVTKNFLLEVLSMNVGLANLNIFACNTGNSDKKLGPVEISGGSGKYNFEWFPADFLDDPNKKEPIVQFPIGYTGTQTYSLRILDEFGCELFTPNVNVTGISPECTPIANAGPDLILCNGSTATLGQNSDLCFSPGRPGDVGSSGTVTRMKFEWTSTNNDFSGSTLPNIVLSGNLNKKPGAFTYTVKVVDPTSGCYAVDQAIVNVRNPWLWKGYETVTEFVDPDCLRRSLACGASKLGNMGLWKNPDNELVSSTNPKYASGAVLPFQYEWVEGSATCSSQFKNGIPSAGIFIATRERPFVKMRVTDAVGCTKDFSTNQGIITTYSPELSLTMAGENSLVICSGTLSNTICLTATYNLHIQNFQSGFLPNTILLKYQRYLDDTPNATCTNPSIVYEEQLKLVDSRKGVYQGVLCIDNSGCSICNSPGCKIKAWIDGKGICEFPVSAEHDYTISSPINFIEEKVDCGEYSVVPQANAKTNQAIKVTLKKLNNCAGFIVNNDFTSRNIGGKSGYVDVLDHSWAKSNATFWAYINPCAVNNLVIAEERSGSPHQLNNMEIEIAPNPFLESTQVSFGINCENGRDDVSIRITNNLGQIIYNVLDKSPLENGQYSLDLQMQNVPSGVYHCILETSQSKAVKKIIKINNN